MGFGDDFLAKRYAAGREEERSELLKFLEEHPEATVDQLKELLRNGDKPRNGKGGGAVEKD